MSTYKYAPATVESGRSMSYEIYSHNYGPDTATNVTVTDTLPPGVTFQSLYSEGGNCTTPAVGGTGTITCTFDEIELLHSAYLYVTVAVNSPGGTTIENTATVTSASDPDASDNSSTVTTSVVDPPPPPANDNFADAQQITGANGSASGTNVSATKQPGEPNHASQAGGASVWYRWQAPAAGYVEFTTDGSGVADTLLGVYNGAGVGALTEVASNDDIGISNYASRVRFQAVANTVYYVALDGESGSQGPLTLGWTQPVAAPTPSPTPPAAGLIAFARYAPGDVYSDIYTMNADGTGQTNITSTPEVNEEEPKWSPDGSKMAVVTYRQDNNVDELVVMNADGTGRQILFTTPGAVFNPEWSPNGTGFVFNVSDSGGDSEVYVVNADGTNLSRLTDNEENDSQPHWSPDSSKIVFLSQSPEAYKHACVMNADGGGRLQLIDSQEGEDFAKWVPGTSRISYVNISGVLYTINADGTDAQQALSQPNEFIQDYAWSRDGSRITFNSFGLDNKSRHYLANADGTGRVLLIEGRIWGLSPQFSPDGSMITFDTIGKGHQRIYAIWADGAAQLSLTDGTSNSYNHDWRPVTPGDTPTGTNVTVAENGAAVTFSNVTTAGETTVTPIDPNSLSGVPGEYVINANSLAFEIHTTAVYSGPITIGFQVPGVNNPITFSALRVLHGEPPPVPNFVDRTVLSPNTPAPNFATRTIYARVPSLSPFIILERRDSTPPVTTATLSTPANAAGWHKTNPTVTLSATDNAGGSGVQSITYSATGAQTIAQTTVNGNSAAITITTEGITTLTYRATDAAGNVEAPKTITVKLDKTAPAITITRPAATVYLLHQALTASYQCTDAGSGAATCTGPVANNAALSLSSVGAKTFTVNATDVAGNTAQKSVNYTVTFGINPLFDQTKANKSGSTIPIKLELVDAAAVNCSASNILVTATGVVRLSNNAPGVLQDPGNSNPDFDFKFTGGQYQFNLKTTGYATGTYRLDFQVSGDPVTHSVQFQIK